MEKLVGVGASPGIAIGVAHVLASRVEIHERRIAAEQVEAELRRFERALLETDAQLARIQAQIAEREGDEQQYRILEAHRLMLSDVHLVERARQMIRDDKAAAEWAVRKALDQIQAVFERIEDPYFRDRKSDVAMVGERLLRNLVGVGDSASTEEAPKGSIAIAHELSPADAAQLGRAEAAGFCTEGGGRTSHTAIVARALGLPYVVGVEGLGRRAWSGMTVVIDGARGEVILDPDADGAAPLRGARGRAPRPVAAAGGDPRRRREDQRRHARSTCRPTSRCWRRSRSPSISAPRRSACSAPSSSTWNAPICPSEDEQYAHAVAALKSVGGRTVTFRTLDLGGDKLPPSVRIPSGTNPAMGLRSIRYSLKREDVFRTQLRALYRAGAVGPMQILFPLISGVAELRAAKRCAPRWRGAGAARGCPHAAKIPLGVMIETPSAATIADLLAAECDFLSIGTNDLIQYSLAADREDEHVGYLYHPLHPAILRVLRQIVVGVGTIGLPGRDVRRHGGRRDVDLGADRPRAAQPVDGAPADPAGEVDRPGRRTSPTPNGCWRRR